MRRLTAFFVAAVVASFLVGVIPAPPPANALPASAQVLVTNQYGGSSCPYNEQLLLVSPFTGTSPVNLGAPPGMNFGVFNEAKPFDLNRKIIALWGGSTLGGGQKGGVGIYDRAAGSWTSWEFKPEYNLEKGANSPHSITVLPDGYYAVAHVGTMAGATGSGFVIVFSPTGTKIQQLSLPSAHGIEYDKPRNAVFAVGATQIKRYTYSTSSHMLTEVPTGTHTLPAGANGGHDLRRRRTDNKYFVTTNTTSHIYDPDTTTSTGRFATLTKANNGPAIGGGVKSVDEGFDGITEYSYFDNDSADVDYFEFLDRPGVPRGFCGNWYKAGRWLFPAGEKVYPEDPLETNPSPETKIGFGFPFDEADEARAAGMKLTYTSNWAVGGNLGNTPQALDVAEAEGTIPVIHWYYWGDQISPACVDNFNGPSPTKCPGKTREKWNQGATALADFVYSKRQGKPAVITLELEFHKNGVETHEAMDGYLETQANLLKRDGISVALGWGEWASTSTYNQFDRAQTASHYAGTQLLWSCIPPQFTLTKIRTATSRTIENANALEARYPTKPVFVYDWSVSSYSGLQSGDPAYGPGGNDDCTTAADYEVEQNTQAKALFDRKQELKDAGVIALVFRELDDEVNRDPDAHYHEIAERWWGFRHNGVEKKAFPTVKNGIIAENGLPDPVTDPVDPTDDWRQEAESFASRPVGGECSDNSASGLKCWNIWANGSISTTTSPPLTSGPKQVTVVAKGDPAASVWPRMVVKVDGIQVMDLTVSSSTWTPYSAVITLGTSAHDIEVTFTNDDIVNGDDRNLLVDYARVKPAPRTWVQEAESFTTKTVGARTSSADASGLAYWNLWSNGYIETTMSVPYTSQHQIQVVARGDVAGGVWPQMEVLVDGNVVLTKTVNTSTWATHRVRVVLTGGNHTLRIRFTDDAIIGNEDRNLRLDLAELYS